MAIITGTNNDDSLNGTAGADTIQGLAGDDFLFGGAGNDMLYGGAGDDRLRGGNHRDSYDGGAGFDLVDFSDTTVAVDASLDAQRALFIGTNFPAETMRDVEGLIGGAFGDILTGDYAPNYLRGGAGNDTLRGNEDADTLVGDAGADSLDGGWGDDSLLGGAGGDTLIGGGGNDFLAGGGGNDVLDGSYGLDIAGYRENTGPVRIDLVAGMASFPGTSWAAEILTRIEGAETGSGNDVLFGNGEANVLIGGAGRDRLFGGGGNDTLDGGTGNDTVNGSAGFDTVSFATTAARTTVDLAQGRAWTSGTRDILVSIEAATGGSGNDRLFGNTRANWLEGGAGNDTLRGRGGNDTILVDPAGGHVLPIGETLPDDGRDVYDGGSGSDTLVVMPAYYHEPGVSDYYGDYTFDVTAAVNLAAGTLSTSFSSAVDTLVSIENVTTADGDDTITGGAGANVIRIGDGANVVDAGAGNDTVYGGQLVWTDQLSARSGDSLDGGSGNDLIYGGGSRDDGDVPFYATYITPGTDRLFGGSGNDTLYAGNGPDALYPGEGHSVMTGGTGADEFHFADAYSYEGDNVAYYPSQRITDFSPDEDDRIVVSMADSGANVTFVGEADADDLALHEAGYSVENGDTVLRVRLEDPNGWPEPAFLTITLEDYTGGLTLDELAFV